MDIVVLCGGLGSERDVSITSGMGVAKALAARGHRVVPLDLFLGYEGDLSDPKAVFEKNLTGEDYSVSEEVPDLELLRKSRGGEGIIGPGVLKLCEAADIVFMALHGADGENGRVQATLDVHGIKYTGCGYLASALAMNKKLSKKLFADAGINVPEGITLSKKDERINIGFPCVVKPCSGGSSVGTSLVASADDYDAALDIAFKYEDEVLVEKFVSGREMTVGVIDGQPMPVLEVVMESGFYDYVNKYQAGRVEEICPADIDGEMEKRLGETAIKVGETLMIESYYRVDFLVKPNGDIVCLEANTLPGMTPTSHVPRMARAVGMDFGELCEKIIEVSMRRYA